MNLPSLAVRRPVTTLMVFLAIALLSVVALPYLRVDLLPDIEPPAASVLVPYPGASASDVESDVTKYLEDELSGVNRLDRLESISRDGLSVVTCKFKWGTDMDVAVNDIRDKLDLVRQKIRDHAPDAKEPMIFRFSSATAPIMVVCIGARESWPHLYRIVDKQIIDELKRVKGVGAIVTYGGLRREVEVEVDAQRLQGYGIPLLQVVRRLREENLDLPSGEIKMGARRYVVRLAGRYHNAQDVAETVVGIHQGRPVRLRDVATVRDAFEEPIMYGWANRRPAVVLVIQKQEGENTVEVCRAIRERLKEIQRYLPSDVEISIPMDNSEFIGWAVQRLEGTLAVAGVLVVLVTFLFLRRVRTSLVVALSMPFSLVIAFLLMLLMDFTINVVSLLSLSVAIGMVVDNAIVVIENITRHVDEEGASPQEGAVRGATEVGIAITASTLTTVAVFLPLIFVSGLSSILFSQLGLIVTFTLGASLLTAMSLAPMLASRWVRPRPAKKADASLGPLRRGYVSILDFALRHRVVVLAGLGGIFFGTLLLLPLVGTDLMPKVDTGDVDIQVALEESARLEESRRVAEYMSGLIASNVPEARAMYAFCGQSEEGIGVALGIEEGPNIAEAGFKLVRKGQRRRSAEQIANLLRPMVQSIPGLTRMRCYATTPLKMVMMGGRKQVEVELLGPDLDELARIAEEVRELFQRTPGAVDVSTSLKLPREEVHVRIDRQKAARLGVDAATVAATLRTALYGDDSTKLRDAGDDFDIRVRLTPDRRVRIEDVNRIWIPSAYGGSPVRLDNVASVIVTNGPVEIKRKNRTRMVVVGADVSGRSLGDVKEDISRGMQRIRLPAGVSYYFGGEVEEQVKAFRDLRNFLLIGLVLVYMIMAAQFESFKAPFIIGFSLPFAMVGVIWAFVLTHTSLSLMSFMASIMLVGVVVNNGIVLVDYTNQLRSRGMEVVEAVKLAAQRRLRPVLMTSLTTIFSMVPLVFGRGEGSEMWQPFGITAIGGLLVSMVVTLVIVPLVYTIVHRGHPVRVGS